MSTGVLARLMRRKSSINNPPEYVRYTNVLC